MIFETQWFTDQMQFYLESVAKFSASTDGITRLPFTSEARKTVDYLKDIMKNAGMQVHEDEAGNIIGRYPGTGQTGKVIMIGSHYDSVIEGGNFDGMAGILSGIVLVEALQKVGHSIQDDIVVVGFCDEEGVRFGTGFFGSNAMLGKITPEDLHRFCDRNGMSIADAMKGYGKDPEEIETSRFPYENIRHFFEIHIEQGPVLDRLKKQIGIVHTIVGIRRYYITIQGRCDHAGTTPMDMRKDPMMAAVKVADDFLTYAKQMGEGTTATIGTFEAKPGAVNIIPSEVVFSLDFRSVDSENLSLLENRLKAQLTKQCNSFGLTYHIEEKLSVSPVKMDEKLTADLADFCRNKGVSVMTMPSGAGHDSLPMGEQVSAAMIFVPSKDGRSHCKEEWTEYAHLGLATELLAEFLMDSD